MGKQRYITRRYTMNYDPKDIDTLAQLIKYESPFCPIIRFEDDYLEQDNPLAEPNICEFMVGDIPTIICKELKCYFVLYNNRLFKFETLHYSNVESERNCIELLDYYQINDMQFILKDTKFGIDFIEKVASNKQFYKLLGQNPHLAIGI